MVSQLAETIVSSPAVRPACVFETAVVSPLFNASRSETRWLMKSAMPWLVAPSVEGVTLVELDSGIAAWSSAGASWKAPDGGDQLFDAGVATKSCCFLVSGPSSSASQGNSEP